MRITNNMLINNMIKYIGNNLTRMDKLQAQLATGKKIQVPSDDPVVAARALKLRTDVAEIQQYQRNLKDAQSWLEITESALSDMGDIFQRVRELIVGSDAIESPGGSAGYKERNNPAQNAADQPREFSLCRALYLYRLQDGPEAAGRGRELSRGCKQQ